ncbi:GntR family transcriptional regulator [Variovorax boronicumulans]|uniref:GntR family transcriptional regulator n=1 Tax=Variovorax boronicumulans TaxID=436515 RepID=UPI0009F19107|nr:GntR family transcriptional regulator [Variovorax boronicumulans]
MRSDEVTSSASSAVIYGILNGLAEQKLFPGQRLVELDLAEQYKVSRNSVREALQQLAAQGVVEIPRNKGAAIRSLSLQETQEVLDVAERMTGLLARSAALGIASGQPRDPIQRALAELDRANTAQDVDAFARARRGLYRALLNTSGSRELKRLFPSIQMPIVYAQHRPSTLQKVRMRDYQAMCDAVLRGDAQAADEAGMAHVQNVRSAITHRFSSSPAETET